MSSNSAAIRLGLLVAAGLTVAGCQTNSVEPLPAPSAQEDLESLDSLAGGPGVTDETPDAPPEEL